MGSSTRSCAGSASAAWPSHGWPASPGPSRPSGSSAPGSRWACAWRFFIAGAQRIPIELYEAIATDGGGRFRQFRWVTLPHLRGEIVIAATVTAISAMSAFDIVFVMTGGGPGVASIVPGLLIYQLAFTSYNVGQASALAVVLSLLVLLVITVLRLAGRERS